MNKPTIESLPFNKEVKYLFIDLETFNLCLSFHGNRPWQCGMLEVTGEQITKSHDILINWSNLTDLRISNEAAIMTRYDHGKVLKLGQQPKEAWQIIRPLLDECDYIVGHNIWNFDIHLIKEYAKMFGGNWLPWMQKLIDTRCVAMGMKTSNQYKLEDDFNHYQIRMSNLIVKGVKTKLELLGREMSIDHNYELLHDAVVDLTLNLKVWNRLKHKLTLI